MNDSNNYISGCPPRSTCSVSKNNSGLRFETLNFPLPSFAIRDTRSWMESRRMGRGKRRNEKKEDDVCIFWKSLQHRKRKKRNKKCLALLHTVRFDEAESVVQWTLRDFAEEIRRPFYWSTRAPALVLGVLLSKHNYRTEHKQAVLPLPYRRKIRFNKPANGVIRDVLNWLFQGVLYIKRIVRFHGTLANLISFTSIRKARVFFFFLRQFSRNLHVLKSIVLRSRDPTAPNSRINVEKRHRIRILQQNIVFTDPIFNKFTNTDRFYAYIL